MILITGASGFLGAHLTDRLSRMGKPVRALYYRNLPDHAARQQHVEWRQCDLLDVFSVEEAMEGVQEVYHCAAEVSFDPRKKDQLLHNNVTATAHVVNEALEQNVRKMVHVSSIASLGRTAQEIMIRENQEWEESKYNSGYSRSKYFAEMEVWRGIAEGLRAVIVNPALIIGPPLPGMKRVWEAGSSRLMKVIYDGFPFYTPGINGWVDVRDVSAAMVALMEHETNGERYILSAGNFSYHEIFSLMAGALEKKSPHILAGKLLSDLVWIWNAVKHRIAGAPVTVTRETALTARKKSRYDNRKFLSLLPAFRYTPIEVTVKDMARQFLTDYSEKK